MAEKFYITTAIDYVNGKPHIGHAFEKIIADCIARWKRLLGYDVFFLTGTDEHGIKNQKAAEALGMKPKEFVDIMSKHFISLWKRLGISYDFFIRTSDKNVHYPAAQEVWKRLEKSGDIYKKKYRGLYCSGCEAFISESDLVNGKCPLHGKEPEVVEEENYFFRLSKYAEKVKELIKKDVIKIIPEARKREILSFISSGVEDISFSRNKERVYWGIPVPGDDEQVMYVWCDALVNYLSGIGFPCDMQHFSKYWPADVHVIGKDILRFHALIWPAMLLSAGLEVPRSILVHGIITSAGKKMSKTLGNVIDPLDFTRRFGEDALRFYLLKEIPTLEDGDFTEEHFAEIYNNELADNFGNLVRRVFVLTEKYFALSIPEGERDEELWKEIEKRIEEYKKRMEEYRLNLACSELWKIFDLLNEYINKNEPWKREENRAKVIRNLLEALAVCGILLNPFLPHTSEKLLKAFSLEKSDVKFENAKFGILCSGKKVGKPEIFFEKIKESAFSKLDIRVGRILEVVDIPESEKLYKLLVDVGNEQRVIVAGIKRFYTQEELKGKKVAVLCNLKPRKILGIVSQGMILAVSTENEIALLSPEGDVGEHLYVKYTLRRAAREISIKDFEKAELHAQNGKIFAGDKPVFCGDKEVRADKPLTGKVS